MDKKSGVMRSAVEDIGFNNPLPFDPLDDTPEPEQPHFVWVKYAAEAAPTNGLDYRADVTIAQAESAAADVAREDALRQLVRATTLQTLGERAVFLIPAPSDHSPPAVRAAVPGPYSTANLPPGVSARAFNGAVRKKHVRFAVVAERNMVLAADWDNYIASCVKKAKPVRTNATDDELLAAVGCRPQVRP